MTRWGILKTEYQDMQMQEKSINTCMLQEIEGRYVGQV